MHRSPLAISKRGSRIDALHYGSIVVVDTAGEILFSVNHPDFPTYLRSSIKMLQAIPAVASGGADVYGFTPDEIAICVASHVGASYHIETVARMLSKIGLDEHALVCGQQEPDDPAERKRLLCSDTPPSQLHNNCSGKHTGMLAACCAMGWPVENYHALEHPLQQWILDLLSDYSGIGRDLIAVGIDGCSLPSFYMPISGAARVIARFVDNAQVDATADARIMRSVAAHPEMINASGGFDTELIRVTGGRFLAKRGAMAMFLMGAVTERYGAIGIAIKLEDGNMAPVPLVVMKALRDLDLLTPEEVRGLEAFTTLPLRNWRGIDVGEVSPNFSMTLPLSC